STERGFGGIGTYFFGYAASAFTFRLLTRHWSKSMGRHRMILFGLAGLFIGQTTLPLVVREWMFLGPAVACGFGHALLFPAVVSLGAGAFPVKYRGSGTTLTLGFVDVGAALSGPVLGSIIDLFDHRGFTQMFLASAAAILTVGVIYALTAARRPDADADCVPDESTIVRLDALPQPVTERERVTVP
ncbi:MAG: MFS transporter, partial [Planctomycetaceae bacterium]